MGASRYKKLLDYLQWRENTGGDDQWIIDEAKARGLPMPQIVTSRPVLRADAQFYLLAYFDLMSDVNDKGAVSWVVYDQYAQRYGERTDRLKRIVGALIYGTVSN